MERTDKHVPCCFPCARVNGRPSSSWHQVAGRLCSCRGFLALIDPPLKTFKFYCEGAPVRRNKRGSIDSNAKPHQCEEYEASFYPWWAVTQDKTLVGKRTHAARMEAPGMAAPDAAQKGNWRHEWRTANNLVWVKKTVRGKMAGRDLTVACDICNSISYCVV